MVMVMMLALGFLVAGVRCFHSRLVRLLLEVQVEKSGTASTSFGNGK
jgi:hypothetical protein